MGKIIVSGDHVAKFVADRLGFGLCPPFVAMGIERDGEVIGGVVLNHFESHDLHVTLAGTGWDRAFIEAVGDYVYRALDCRRMTAITEHPKVVEYAERLGGKVEGVLREHFGEGRNATIVGILRSEWKFAKQP